MKITNQSLSQLKKNYTIKIMTRLQLYEYSLIECNKNQAPSLLIDDYNYMIQKSIYNYVAKKRKISEVDLSLDEDLNALKEPYLIRDKALITTYGVDKVAYQIPMPDNYLHLKNCIAVYKVTKAFGCYKVNDTITFGATRMTAELEPVFSWNYYITPKWFKPFYYINKQPIPKRQNIPNNPDEKIIDNVITPNAVKIGVELHIGNTPDYISLDSVKGWYYKIPENIKITQDDIDSDFDNTPHLEFPDYVCYEIIKELVVLLLEHDSNPRLQTNIPISMSSNAIQQ